MIRTREATREDYETIREIAHAGWLDTYAYPPEKVQRAIDNCYDEAILDAAVEDGMTILVAEDDDGHVHGFCSYTLNKPDNVGEIVRLYLRKASRRQGIGTMLVEAAVREAEEAKKDEMHVHVFSGNSAQRFYEKKGFTEAIHLGIDPEFTDIGLEIDVTLRRRRLSQ